MEKQVRRAVPADIDALLNLLLYVADCHSSGRPELFCSGRAAYTREALLGHIQKEDMDIFVCTDETGSVQGMILCRVQEMKDHKILRDARTLWVEDMSVSPGAQKEGYGKLLLNFVKEYGREKGCARLELNVWAFNEGAHGFYLHEGMREQRHIMEFDL